MILFITFQSTDGFAMGFCFLLFLISISGKISPKFVLIIITAFLFSYFQFVKPIVNITDTLPVTPPFNTPIVEDTRRIEQNRGQEPLLEDEEEGYDEAEEEMNNPQEVEKRKEVLVNIPLKPIGTYAIEGFWKWDEEFVKAMERETGWRKAPKGKQLISVEHTGLLSKTDEGKSQAFVYSGGKIIIKVNEKLCCCEEAIRIPGGISGVGFSRTNQLIQQKITELMLFNKLKVIQQLNRCLLD